ncbi:helix-turn-helix transcriptional regulator [Lentzea sp. CC55]|uniref:helix-turn-helix domain-containing protein n=1 Tax=Lentzea sp. CC55 TaxID=2884909 RepID=UPI001F3AF1E6|nr:helix-turn-helix transcriptional regulator [Lentzea sp. CC55]MCG8926160.1 helix-turn-helix domain-containing protein [Lentzea sp. CC55]
MPKRISTVRGREFGAGLRAVITGTGLTSRAVADIVGWHEAKLSDVVNGKGGATLVEIATLLGVCRANAAETAHLLALCPEMHIRGWWQQHGMYPPIQLRTVFEELKAAKTLISWHTHMVPLFLQTADYMREVVRASSTTPADELQDRVKAQLGMQELLRCGVKCTFLIHELALHLPVGGAEVHTGQLLHLLHMANRPRITIRIVPTAHGSHAGLAGPFTYLDFPKYEPLVWTDTENSSLFVEAPEAIKGYEKVIRALDESSLDEVESKGLIVRLCDASRTDVHDA